MTFIYDWPDPHTRTLRAALHPSSDSTLTQNALKLVHNQNCKSTVDYIFYELISVFMASFYVPVMEKDGK